MEIEISLLGRGGRVHPKSGLNWAFASENKRKRNPFECCIPVSSKSYAAVEAFFRTLPPTAQATDAVLLHVETHDGVLMTLRLQGTTGSHKRKQISSAGDTTLIGKYLLERCLKIRPGTAVTTQDLIQYGATTVKLRQEIDSLTGQTKVVLDFTP